MAKRKAIGGLFEKQERIEQQEKLRNPLDELDATVDWELFREEIVAAAGYSKLGRKGFDPLLMFKVLVLQKYYNLSEEQTEYQILDRRSFLKFLGLEHGGKVPDKNTVWDFKERLGADGVRRLFEFFDAVLRELGVVASKGKIIDASFVEVPRQRNSRVENAEIKEGKVPGGWSRKKRSHKDTDARWAKKNKETHYGYKNHAKVDRATKLVEDYAVSDAAVHDSKEILGLVDGRRDGEVFADSAYRSAEISGALRKKRVRNRIHEKGYRNRPLDGRQKASNTAKSRVRARVEHVFGFQANSMGADRIRTVGMERARREIGLSNLVYNLFRVGQLNYSIC